GLNRPEFITVPTSDGVALNAWLIKPKAFDPARRYPLLMNVYGGPGSQTVTDSWGGPNYLWHQMLAQEGYLVASVDNRGTGGRGARLRRQPSWRLPACTWHRRRQRALPEQRPAGGAARSRQQAVRHADLSRPDACDRGRQHA